MKKVLVIGGGAYQTPLIKRIVEKGYEAYCLDYNPSSPGFRYATAYSVIDVLNKDACFSYAKSMCVDAVMTYGATLTLPTVAYIGECLGFPTINQRTAEMSKNKYHIKECLDKAGCNIKGDYFAIDSTIILEDEKIKTPCVIKPSDGSGSKGVMIVNDKKDFRSAMKTAFSNARFGEIYCEEYIFGDEYSVEAFVDGDDIYVYAIVKTTFEKNGNSNEDIEYGHRTPAGISKEKASLIKEEIVKAIKALGVNMGSVNFDVIISKDDNKPYIVDCGIRVGQNLIASHLIPLSRGVDILDNTIEQALGNKIDGEPRFRKYIATRLLIYNPGVIKKIGPIHDLIGKDGIKDIILRKSVGDEQLPYKDKSDTCGWVVCEGNSPEEAEELASKARKRIKDYITIE